MIHLIGLDTDPTLVWFARRAVAAGHHVKLVNLRAVTRQPWRVELDASSDRALFHNGPGRPLPLSAQGGYYVRLIDLSPVLPAAERGRWRHLIGALAAYLDGVRGPVVNRPGGQLQNGAKPLHEWWLSHRGLRVPASLTSSDPARIAGFMDRHGPVVLKAVCGTRGRARLVTAGQLAGFAPAAGPVHLQQWVDGYDVRVHLVDGEPFAERIDTDAVDYREPDARSRHRPAAVPEELRAAMGQAAKEMDLRFTGWDFRVDRAGRWWCLEANPMPGYHGYDRRCGGAITRALCRLLAPDEG